MALHRCPTWDQLLSLAAKVQERTLATPGRALPFKVAAQEDKLVITPGSTKYVRREPRKQGEQFLQRYAETGSLTTSHYQDLTVNASYLIALLKIWLES